MNLPQQLMHDYRQEGKEVNYDDAEFMIFAAEIFSELVHELDYSTICELVSLEDDEIDELVNRIPNLKSRKNVIDIINLIVETKNA